jgi:hypothetical protein
MYLVVIQSTVMALLGGRLRWHRMVRTGAATAHAQGETPPPAPGPVAGPPDLAAGYRPVSPPHHADQPTRALPRPHRADQPTQALPTVAVRRQGHARTGPASGAARRPGD